MVPHVGMVMQHRTFQWRVVRPLGTGPFSDVYEVEDSATSQHFAMKIEKVEKCIRPILKLDALVLSQLTQESQSVGFPRLIAAGRCADFKYVVMQLLGPDLRKLHRAMPDRKFIIGTALRVARDTLDRIQALHGIGWLCRDVKAPNFAIGLGEDAATIYMLDFGFARRYIDGRGYLLPKRTTAALLGTIHYASLASHFNQEQCRRDDLESWFYMCVELITGRLPWTHLEPISHHKIIAEWKQFARNTGRDDFLMGVPAEFDDILIHIDSLSFTDVPDYGLLGAKIERAMERLQVDHNAPLDWQVNDGHLIEKSHFVGHAGESHMASERLRQARLKTEQMAMEQLAASKDLVVRESDNVENTAQCA